MTRSKERGSTLMEVLPVLSLLLVFVSGLFVGAYWLLAKTWLSFQTEQALYCVAEDRPHCRMQFEKRVQSLLPWGKLRALQLVRTAQGSKVEVQWRVQDFSIQFKRELSHRLVAKNRVLRW